MKLVMGKLAGAAALALGIAAPAAAQETDWVQVRKEWNQPVEPFTIAGDSPWTVNYVGTAGISVYLITGPGGHILIDGGMEESVPQIVANIGKLGYRLTDIKFILINHAHWDHAGGLAELKRLTGAKLLASAGDKSALEAGFADYRPDLAPFPKVAVDGLVADGQIVSTPAEIVKTAHGQVMVHGKPMMLDGVKLTAHLTPGHTRGCTSWTMTVNELKVIFACSLSVADQPLAKGKGYDNAVRDFRASFARLKRLKADIFLNFHPAAFDMEAKRAKLLAGDKNAFVDPGELRRRVEAAEKAFDAELAKAQ